MWQTGIKFLALCLLRNRFNEAKDKFKGDLNNIKDNIADLAESRAAIYKENINYELSRLVRSFVSIMFALVAITCVSITAIIWLVTIALNNPYRNIIFSFTLLVPLIISIGICLLVRYTWKKEPLFQQSIIQIEQDWLLFRKLDGLDQTRDVADINEQAK